MMTRVMAMDVSAFFSMLILININVYYVDLSELSQSVKLRIRMFNDSSTSMNSSNKLYHWLVMIYTSTWLVHTWSVNKVLILILLNLESFIHSTYSTILRYKQPLFVWGHPLLIYFVLRNDIFLNIILNTPTIE